MFRCHKCNNTSEKGEKQNSIVLQTRPKTYEVKRKIKRKLVTKTYQGSEIVKEAKVCGKCYGKDLRIETT